MNNEEWKKAYREGFADGYAAAKKEMNYQNFPPVYYGGATPTGPIPRGSAVMGTPVTAGGYVSDPPVASVPTGGLSYSLNEHFVTGMSVDNVGC
jgi:hypothetical protein